MLDGIPGLTKHGFYYDFLLKQGGSERVHETLENDGNSSLQDLLTKDSHLLYNVKQDDFEELTDIVKNMIQMDAPIDRFSVPVHAAMQMFRYSPLKLAYLSKFLPYEMVSLYRCQHFIDIAKGPLVYKTSQVQAFKLTEISASAYKNDTSSQTQLNRVHGIAFPSENTWNEWQEQQQESQKRDHRTIGRDQKLFMMHPMSTGSIFMLPHGTRIVNRLLEYLRKQYRVYGYEEVMTPMLFNKDLWVKSGHWDNYKEDMFLINEMSDQIDEETVESLELGLKPMNCPGHCLIYASEVRSYKDLPIRFADFTALHRYFGLEITS